MKTQHTSMNDILSKPHTSLGFLTHKVTQIQRINQHLQTILPKELRNNCYLANIRDDTLVFAAKSAAWLTRLRFEAIELSRQLREQFPTLTMSKTRCIIVPEYDKPTVPVTSIKKPHMDQSGAELLKATAKIMPCEELKDALLKLARNAD